MHDFPALVAKAFGLDDLMKTVVRPLRDSWLKLLEKRGWTKSPSQTPIEFAAAIPAAELIAPVAQMTEMYQSARFGNHPARVSEMSALLARIRDSLRNRNPPSR